MSKTLADYGFLRTPHTHRTDRDPFLSPPRSQSRKRPSPSSTTPAKRARTSLTQLQIVSNKPTVRKCPECGMELDTASDADATLHDRHHRRAVLTRGIPFPNVPREWVVEHVGPKERVVKVREGGKVKARVLEVLRHVDAELGAVERTGTEQRSETVLMYVIEGRVVGVVVAERIRCSFADTQDLQNSYGDPEVVDDREATCGVSRVWVCASFRRRGIATKLLETLRGQFVYATTIGREQVAFSQMTSAGRELARRYFGGVARVYDDGCVVSDEVLDVK